AQTINLSLHVALPISTINNQLVGVTQDARYGLRGAVDGGDRARVPHPRRADHADRADPRSIVVSGQHEAEGPQARIEMLGADDRSEEHTSELQSPCNL